MHGPTQRDDEQVLLARFATSVARALADEGHPPKRLEVLADVWPALAGSTAPEPSGSTRPDSDAEGDGAAGAGTGVAGGAPSRADEGAGAADSAGVRKADGAGDAGNGPAAADGAREADGAAAAEDAGPRGGGRAGVGGGAGGRDGPNGAHTASIPEGSSVHAENGDAAEARQTAGAVTLRVRCDARGLAPSELTQVVSRIARDWPAWAGMQQTIDAQFFDQPETAAVPPPPQAVVSQHVAPAPDEMESAIAAETEPPQPEAAASHDAPAPTAAVTEPPHEVGEPEIAAETAASHAATGAESTAAVAQPDDQARLDTAAAEIVRSDAGSPEATTLDAASDADVRTTAPDEATVESPPHVPAATETKTASPEPAEAQPSREPAEAVPSRRPAEVVAEAPASTHERAEAVAETPAPTRREHEVQAPASAEYEPPRATRPKPPAPSATVSSADSAVPTAEPVPVAPAGEKSGAAVAQPTAAAGAPPKVPEPAARRAGGSRVLILGLVLVLLVGAAVGVILVTTQPTLDTGGTATQTSRVTPQAVAPAAAPTSAPAAQPAVAPTSPPVVATVPALAATAAPTAAPTAPPIAASTTAPTPAPTTLPTQAATAVPTLPPTVAPTIAPTSAPVPRPVADQSFTAGDALPNWPNDQNSTAWSMQEGYRLFARRPTEFVAIGNLAAQRLRDVVVTARFAKVGGPPGGGFGIIVRDQGPDPRDGLNQSGRYYVLEVGDKGEVGIWRRADNQWVDLVSWTASSAVRPGNAENELTVTAIGPRLTLSVNGVEAARAEDATLTEGTSGIFVGGDQNQVLLRQLRVEAIP